MLQQIQRGAAQLARQGGQRSVSEAIRRCRADSASGAQPGLISPWIHIGGAVFAPLADMMMLPNRLEPTPRPESRDPRQSVVQERSRRGLVSPGLAPLALPTARP